MLPTCSSTLARALPSFWVRPCALAQPMPLSNLKPGAVPQPSSAGLRCGTRGGSLSGRRQARCCGAPGPDHPTGQSR